jgi:hypothetical protein
MGLEDIEKMSGELAMADGYRGQPLIVDLPVDRCRLLNCSHARQATLPEQGTTRREPGLHDA